MLPISLASFFLLQPGGDPFFPSQWHLQPPREVVVALIDSGMDLTHEDLAPNLWVNPGEIAGNRVDDDGNGYVDDVHGWDFVDDDADPTDPCYGHGTATAGVLGAAVGNGVGIAGAAPHVRLMVLRVLGCLGTSTEPQLVEAIRYARRNGAQVIQAVVLISSAWGLPRWDQPGAFPGLCEAIEECGLLFVSPSGNEGIDLDPPTARYPPSCARANQIVVTASGPDDRLAPFGSWGAQTVDLAAPGVSIWTTAQAVGAPQLTDPNGYRALDGSSFAAPQVVAVAANLLRADPTLDVATLRARVLEHVEVLPAFSATATGGRLSAFFTPAPPPPSPPGGPVLHLALDDASGVDSSGAGNDMACSACPEVAPGLAGAGGNACDFSDDWLYRESGALLGAFPSGGATTFTIAAWIELDHTTDLQPIASKQAAGERGWILGASHFLGGRLRFESWPEGAASPQLVDGATVLAPGAVYHVAVTRDALGVTTLYVDGAADASGITLPPRGNAQPLEIARYAWSAAYTRHLDGRLDEVRIYDTALTAAEVLALAEP